MSIELLRLRNYKARMRLAWIIGIVGFIILFLIANFDEIKIWHFAISSISLIILCKIFHYYYESKFENYFSNEESFRNLILNNINYFFGFRVSDSSKNIKEFVIFKDVVEGEPINIVINNVFKTEGIVEEDETLFNVHFGKILYSHSVNIEIKAPKRGIINIDDELEFNGSNIECNKVICSVNTSEEILHEYIKEQEIIAEEYRKREEEQIKSEIRERLLEKERRKNLELEVKEEMSNEGLFQDDVSYGKIRESIPQEVQDRVWRRDGGTCVKCGSQEKLEFDHIIPISKGGANTYRNIQLLCESCNRKKSNHIG